MACAVVWYKNVRLFSCTFLTSRREGERQYYLFYIYYLRLQRWTAGDPSQNTPISKDHGFPFSCSLSNGGIWPHNDCWPRGSNRNPFWKLWKRRGPQVEKQAYNSFLGYTVIQNEAIRKFQKTPLFIYEMNTHALWLYQPMFFSFANCLSPWYNTEDISYGDQLHQGRIT